MKLKVSFLQFTITHCECSTRATICLNSRGCQSSLVHGPNNSVGFFREPAPRAELRTIDSENLLLRISSRRVQVYLQLYWQLFFRVWQSCYYL